MMQRPSLGAGGVTGRCHSFAQALEMLELHLGSENTFNPARPALRAQLLEKLQRPQNASIAAMQGFRGGLNEGVWFVTCAGQEDLVLKLVRCRRIAPNILTEAENFQKLSREHANAFRDPLLALPFKIFSCVGRGGMKVNDLIVMRRVPGERLAEWIARKWHTAQLAHIWQLFERLGARLAEYHCRYCEVQHGDFQPSNIFYDEETDDLCFIDMGGMGVPTTETDIEHFVKSLNLLSQSYDQQAAVEGEFHFKQGYQRARGR